jgi:hypothetical protein
MSIDAPPRVVRLRVNECRLGSALYHTPSVRAIDPVHPRRPIMYREAGCPACPPARPGPSGSVRVRPGPSGSVRVRPGPSGSVRVGPGPSGSVRVGHQPSAGALLEVHHPPLDLLQRGVALPRLCSQQASSQPAVSQPTGDTVAVPWHHVVHTIILHMDDLWDWLSSAHRSPA